MRLIDADAVLKHIDAYWGTCQRIRKPRNGETTVMLDIKAIIEAWPAVDAVPVVRCRDCKYYEEQDETIGTCLLTESGANIKGYCAWADRGEENGK